jgi:hypothetical protein
LYSIDVLFLNIFVKVLKYFIIQERLNRYKSMSKIDKVLERLERIEAMLSPQQPPIDWVSLDTAATVLGHPWTRYRLLKEIEENPALIAGVHYRVNPHRVACSLFKEAIDRAKSSTN